MDEPGMEPPPGHFSNFDDPDKTMYYYCIAANVIAIPVCTIFVALRLLARYRMGTKIMADDIACVIGYIGFMGYCAICLTMLRYGGGLHQWDVPKPLLESYFKTVYATMVNYGPTALATKAAILLFLTRVFSPYQTYVKWIYGFLGLMALYYIIMLVLKIIICRPIALFWDSTLEGQCFNQRILILVDNVISLVSDLVILLLPCPLTRTLQVGTMAKIKIGVVFGVGGIACVFSLFRLVLIINNGQSPDQTYAFVEINLTGIAECGIGLICACFPLLPALWKSILHKEKPGYSSNSKSFEMLNSKTKNTKNSRATSNRNGTLNFDNEFDSDENILMPSSKAYITTQIHSGHDARAKGVAKSNSREDSSERAPGSATDSHIVRTVEVSQYEEEKEMN